MYLGGDEKWLRLNLGVSTSRTFLSVLTEARHVPSTDNVVGGGQCRSTNTVLRQLAQRHMRTAAAVHGGADHMPLLQYPTGWYESHTVVCVLHLAMALGRVVTAWVEANVASPAVCIQVAAVVRVPCWSTNPKADDARSLLRNFALIVPLLLPGAAPPATVRSVTDLAWAVDRISVGLCHSTNRAELLAHDYAVRVLPMYTRNFRIAMGISRSLHYVYYLECEVGKMVALLSTFGQV